MSRAGVRLIIEMKGDKTSTMIICTLCALSLSFAFAPSLFQTITYFNVKQELHFKNSEGKLKTINYIESI